MHINTLMTQVRSGYALAEPLVYSTDSIKWSFSSASRRRSPIVIGFSEGDVCLEEVAELTEFFAKAYSQVPAALSLEKCNTFADAFRAFKSGYSNVVMNTTDDFVQLKEAAHLAHAMGGTLELALDMDKCVNGNLEEVENVIKSTGIDGLFIKGENTNSFEEKNSDKWLPLLLDLSEKISIPVSLDGDYFSDINYLSFAARTGISRFRLSDKLSLAAIKSAKQLVSMPETDRRGLSKLQASVREGYESRLMEYIHIFNSHNRW